MIDGFLAKEHVLSHQRWINASPIDALKKGNVAAVSLMEPWI
jgi:hypothetical protein